MKTIFKNILFSLIITLLFLIGLEVACRIMAVHIKKKPIFLFYGRSFFELKIKSITNKIYDLTHREEEIKTDKLGQKTIWTFGGSTTVCVYVKRRDSWPARLGYYLGERSDSTVTVINKAAPGGASGYHAGVFKNAILGNEKIPNLAIVYMGLNDASKIVHYPGQVEKMKKIKPSFLDRLNCRLMDISLLYAALKEKYYQFAKKHTKKIWRRKSLHSPTAVRCLKYTEEQLNLIIDIANDFNIKLIICTVPLTRWYLNKHPEMKVMYQNVVDVMKETAVKRKINFINIDEEMFKKHRNFEKRFVHNGIHLNEKGCDLVAQYLADYIIQHNMLKN